MSDRYIHSMIDWCHVSYILVSYSGTERVAQHTPEIIHLFNTASEHQLIWKLCNSASWKRIFPETKNITRGNEILPAETKYSPRKWNVKIFPTTPKYSSHPTPAAEKLFPAAKLFPAGQKIFPAEKYPPRPRNYSPRPRKYSPRKKIFPAAEKIFPAAQKIFPAEKIFPAAEKIFPAAKKYSFICPSQASVVQGVIEVSPPFFFLLVTAVLMELSFLCASLAVAHGLFLALSLFHLLYRRCFLWHFLFSYVMRHSWPSLALDTFVDTCLSCISDMCF